MPPRCAAAGLAVETLAPLDDFPDAVFVEDPAFVLPEGAILLKPGTPTRIGEAAEIAPALRRRFARVLELDEGFADGGDILILPDEILIGLSGRTDKLGAKRFCELAREPRPQGPHRRDPAGRAPPQDRLRADRRGNGDRHARAGRNVRGIRGDRDARGRGAGANLLRLNDTILVGADYPRTIDLLAGRAPQPRPAARVAEIRKIDAGLSCLSLRW